MSGTVPVNNRSSRGSALLVVLIMLGVIAVLAAAVARSVSGAALELSAARATAQSELDLRAGIELGAAAILKLGDEMRSADAAIDLADRRITVRVTNERARIDLNRAKADVLTGLLKTEGLDENEAASLAANVVDWRGGDTSKKPTVPQLEDQHLGGLPLAAGFNTPTSSDAKRVVNQTPTLRLFMHPVQLVSVPGFSKALVKRLFPSLTVANGDNKINPFIAGPDVLNALPGASTSKVDAFIDARDGNVSRDTAIQLLGVDKDLLSEDPASGWRLQITSIPRVGPARHSEAIIAGVDPASEEPYHVLYILDDRDQYARQARY